MLSRSTTIQIYFVTVNARIRFLTRVGTKEESQITSLRKEVEALRKEKPKTNPQSKPSKKSTTTTDSTSEAELKKILTDVLSQVKKDYDNLSPVTALVLFALGAMLGGALAKHKGGR